MRALHIHAKLHAFYLTALWLWAGILVVIKWWIVFDVVAYALLAIAALVLRMQATARSRSREKREEAGRATSSAPRGSVPMAWMTDWS